MNQRTFANRQTKATARALERRAELAEQQVRAHRIRTRDALPAEVSRLEVARRTYAELPPDQARSILEGIFDETVKPERSPIIETHKRLEHKKSGFKLAVRSLAARLAWVGFLADAALERFVARIRQPDAPRRFALPLEQRPQVQPNSPNTSK